MSYSEVFTRSGILSRTEAEEKVKRVLEVHNAMLGWSHKDPEIIPEKDGTFTVKIPLKKE